MCRWCSVRPEVPTKGGAVKESKRITAFRRSVVKEIPKFPNDKATLAVLEQKPLASLLIDYANWAIRYIAPRPRAVLIEQTASNDPRWKGHEAEIQILLNKAVGGDDLTPHLSLQPHTRGFTPASAGTGSDVDRWADKDFLLNVMGFHHLHLDAAPSNQMRSDNVLFVRVNRDTFTVAGIFNHSVFEATQIGSSMTVERERLWEIFDEHTMRGHPPGTVVVTSPIANSGHPIYIVQLAMDYARIIRELDPKLDDPTYAGDFYRRANMRPPTKIKLKWYLQFLSLGLLDERRDLFFSLRHGPN